MQSYEQTLRLFERWCLEEANITEPGQVLESTIRHYICSLQERGKYTFYAAENCAITYDPTRRRDFSQEVSTTTINNYIRNLKAFFAWYADTTMTTSPMLKVRQLHNDRKAQEYLEDHEIEKLLKIFDRSYYPEHRDFMAIMLILDTGMRLGECLQVTTDDIDMDDRTICLPAENTKGRRTRFVFSLSKPQRACSDGSDTRIGIPTVSCFFRRNVASLWRSIPLNPDSSGIWEGRESRRLIHLMLCGIILPSGV